MKSPVDLNRYYNNRLTDHINEALPQDKKIPRGPLLTDVYAGREVEPGSYFPTHQASMVGNEDDGDNNKPVLNEDASHFDQHGERIVYSTNHFAVDLPVYGPKGEQHTGHQAGKEREMNKAKYGYDFDSTLNPHSDAVSQSEFPRTIPHGKMAAVALRRAGVSRVEAKPIFSAEDDSKKAEIKKELRALADDYDVARFVQEYIEGAHIEQSSLVDVEELFAALNNLRDGKKANSKLVEKFNEVLQEAAIRYRVVYNIATGGSVTQFIATDDKDTNVPLGVRRRVDITEETRLANRLEKGAIKTKRARLRARAHRLGWQGSPFAHLPIEQVPKSMRKLEKRKRKELHHADHHIHHADHLFEDLAFGRKTLLKAPKFSSSTAEKLLEAATQLVDGVKAASESGKLDTSKTADYESRVKTNNEEFKEAEKSRPVKAPSYWVVSKKPGIPMYKLSDEQAALLHSMFEEMTKQKQEKLVAA